MTPKIYRQEIMGYIILILIIAACIYYLDWSYINNIEQSSLILLGGIGFLIYFIIMLINYARTKITVDDFYVTYETLFKKKQAAFGEIIKIESYAKMEGISHQGQIHGKYILAIHTQSGKIEIKIKLFKRKS